VQAAFKGASEIGFTVISMSVSLVAVFIPLLLNGWNCGPAVSRVAVTLSIAIGVFVAGISHHDSHHVRQVLRPAKDERHNFFIAAVNGFFDKTL